MFVSLAYREYESWFMASAEALAGKRAFPQNLTCPDQFESKRDAKGWLTDQMTGSSVYRETVDQAALTALFDLALARERSHSFARLWRICEEIFRTLQP